MDKEREKTNSPEPEKHDNKFEDFGRKLFKIACAVALGAAGYFGAKQLDLGGSQNSSHGGDDRFTPISASRPQASTLPETEQTDCIDFGPYGEYCAVFNSNTGKSEIIWDKGSMSREGLYDLSDLKRNGGSVSFVLPSPAYINSVAGDPIVTTVEDEGNNHVANTQRFKPGNPITDEEGNPLIPAGAIVSINYDPNNNSNGLSIEFEDDSNSQSYPEPEDENINHSSDLGKTYEESTSENIDDIRIDFGPYGVAKPIYNENLNAYVVTLEDWSLVKQGPKNLDALKSEGGQFSFTMPLSGLLNSSAGKVYVNDQMVDLGNPVEDENGNPVIKKGSRVYIEYLPGNKSAGLELIFPSGEIVINGTVFVFPTGK